MDTVGLSTARKKPGESAEDLYGQEMTRGVCMRAHEDDWTLYDARTMREQNVSM